VTHPEVTGAVAVPDDFITALHETSEWSARTRHLEADLRSDLFTVLGGFARNVLALPPQDIRQEGTGRSGRFDTMLGRAVIEYKRPGLLDSAAERERAAAQGIGYLEDETLGAQVVILTDGKTWGFLRDADAGPEPGEQGWLFDEGDPAAARAADRFAWQSNSPSTAVRVLTLLGTLRSAPVSSVSVTARLGPNRPEVIGLVGLLADRLAARRPLDRPDTLFRQWIALAGVTYGISDDSTPFPAPGKQALLGDRMAVPLAGAGYAGSLFVLHTYVSLATKLLACELLALRAADQDARPTQWISLPDAELAARLASMEKGDLTDSLGAPDMLAGDLFGWWVPLLKDNPGLTAAVRDLISAMSELAWARIVNAGGVAVDLLRSLYQAIVPRQLRKALGEFFTPRWVAERVLSKALELASPLPADRPVRVLDPSCGSGTFLVAALRDGLRRLVADGHGDDAARIEALLDSTIGFDVNPVAPVMTRVNLLLALGDRAQRLPEVRFRVYQADSILLPEPRMGELKLGEAAEAHVLPLEVGDILVPDVLATLDGVAVLRGQFEDGIEHKRTPAVFASRLRAELAQIMPGIAGADLDDAVEGSQTLYVFLADLSERGRNGVWSRIIEQSFAPRAVGEVDIVIGNPPWVSWKSLPDKWKKRSEATWRRWGLWQTTGTSTPLSDVSTLLLARSVATYAPHGVVALLLPNSVLISDPSGTRVRRGRLKAATADALAGGDDVSFRPLHVDLFSALNPFSPDASNEPVALYLRSGEPLEPATGPWPSQRWERSEARSRISPTASWAALADDLVSRDELMGPVDPADVSSPWARAAGDGDAPTAPREQTHYRWGRGYETRGVDGILFVEVTSDTPSGRRGLVTVRSRPELGRNTSGLEARTAQVEPGLLFPLVKGADVQAWRIRPSGLYAIAAHDQARGFKALGQDELIARSPRLFDYLEPHLDQLRGRSLYRAGASAVEGPWSLSGPLHQIDPAAHLVLVRYIAGGGRPVAAVAGPAADARLGRVVTPLPNNKTNIFYTKDADEAHYLAGWINSFPVQSTLERYSAATGITPAALERVAIPAWNRQDDGHRQIFAAARTCETVAAAGNVPDLTAAWRTLDLAVAAVAGVPEAAVLRRDTGVVVEESYADVLAEPGVYRPADQAVPDHVPLDLLQ